ncbi:MAG: S-adenosylmethionine:tRNA ribosyltransferase-isomerase, partial [Selenomonas sp.]|nr:S-adenosylmethionine:tRNA ribosyltransferase-isomerase [Selenomonas sp.]
MNISDFDYFLPEKQIAQVPADPRDSSRMMVLSPKTQTIEHRHFYQLDEYLMDG